MQVHGGEDCRGDWSAVKAFQGDVRDASAIKEVINLVAREFGAFDLVVANAQGSSRCSSSGVTSRPVADFLFHGDR
jgi:NAD(P)-dependent dehydrogenase (short-subunit alcohol dehydrogenase family)